MGVVLGSEALDPIFPIAAGRHRAAWYHQVRTRLHGKRRHRANGAYFMPLSATSAILPFAQHVSYVRVVMPALASNV